MLRASLTRCLALLCGLMVMTGLGCGAARGEDKLHETKLKAVIHRKDGTKETIVFNPKSKDDVEKLRKVQESLAMGEMEEVLAERSVNLMELRWEVGLWTVVVFILLYLILKRAAWGPMLEGLKKREDSIFGALADAQKARDEAKAIREQLQKELDKASEKVREMLDEARRDGEKTAADVIAKGRAEVQAEGDRKRREIEMASDQALKQLTEHAAELATLVSAKAIKRDLGVDDHRRLVDDALAELDKTITGRRQEVWGTQA
ncbi:MAG: F0F1 ATP synthase subunit B [Gemmataceae bacterium]|nr:F0F1 ATP synthase subunit B [Gemmataceae bacterium]